MENEGQQRMSRQRRRYTPYDCSDLLLTLSLDGKLLGSTPSLSEASRLIECCRVSVGDCCESVALESCEWGSMVAEIRCTALRATSCPLPIPAHKSRKNEVR